MRQIDKNDKNKEVAVYLPHHAVIREDKTTSKVRVVFNASEKNKNGVSLNDTLMVGPTLQSDLRHTVLRWRLHPIALIADIVKMYRQVRISEEDAMFQRILWRDSPETEIKDYELVTVTFGTASAPYQAVRTLQQVAYDEGKNNDLAPDMVLNCFYMDDLMTGCNNVRAGLEIYRQMTALLEKGGFTLQKWNSNNQEIVDRIQEIEGNTLKGQIGQIRTKDNLKKDNMNKDSTNEHKNIQDIKQAIEHNKPKKPEDKEKEVEIKLDSTIKILGLTWNRTAEHLEANGTEWHFIPPHSPNFGGLWEAGVKSTKFHLKRVIGKATLTFEELTTLLSQVEACLNSRPMSTIRVDDPGEPLPLTPGHFLIGEPLVNVPDNKYVDSIIHYLSRWQFIQRMLQSFWRRWSHEYLVTLTNRYKWSSQVAEPKIGDIVLVKEDDLPPSRWLMGRIIQKHPGDDNITRVVTLRTKSSTIKRPTSKLCILPIVE